MMFSIILILVTIISGVYWLYDMLTIAPLRKKQNKDEPSLVSYARGVFLILLVVTLIKVFNVGILLLLTILTFGSFIVWVIDRLLFAKARLASQGKEPLLVDYAKSLFPIFLIVLLIRSFVVQPFRVPTGSLEPTIMPNDFVLVNQFAYGLRLPVIHTKILNIGEPKIGDIVVFRDPSVPGKDLIKSLIGLPGDHIVYKNKVLYINGKEIKQNYVGNATDIGPIDQGGGTPVSVMEENLNGIKHKIYLFKHGGETTGFNFTVPKGYYFMMGDNRDNSADSRVWGFMPESAIIGKAFMIFFSWNHGIDWGRIGNKL